MAELFASGERVMSPSSAAAPPATAPTSSSSSSPRAARWRTVWRPTGARRARQLWAVPEVPESLSADAKDFLARCLVSQASDWCTAAQLLEHPFLASAGVGVYAKPQAAESKWVSPKSTLDAALWETESDTEEAEHEHSRHSV
ncbi:hypothetical protein ZWY2020_044559 [Hordeum vulgare]|nr:hypothetical protein ZWY2020_044559 [Hordeum vulgare]